MHERIHSRFCYHKSGGTRLLRHSRRRLCTLSRLTGSLLSNRRRLLNRSQRSTLRTQLRGFRALMVTEPSQEDADKAFSSIVKSLDKAASKNLIHSNTASRTKSRLAKLKKSINQDLGCFRLHDAAFVLKEGVTRPLFLWSFYDEFAG